MLYYRSQTRPKIEIRSFDWTPYQNLILFDGRLYEIDKVYDSNLPNSFFFQFYSWAFLFIFIAFTHNAFTHNALL